MKKPIILILTAVLLACCLGACTRTAEPKPDETGYTFTDDLGREIAVNSPRRVAALLGSYADLWLLAGGSVCASADDAWEDLQLPLSEDAVNLGGTKSLSFESLLLAQPDFVLASTNTTQHLDWQQNLENAGITTAYFDVSDFADYLRVLKIFTDITGQTSRYEQYGTALQSRIDEILKRNQAQSSQTALVLRVSASSIHAKNSSGTVLGTMLRDFGCVNIADSDETLLENLSVESILLKNPDKIFIVQVGDNIPGIQQNVENLFRENPIWNELPAVKNGHVYYMDKHLYNLKPNARWAEAYEKLEVILYADQ